MGEMRIGIGRNMHGEHDKGGDEANQSRCCHTQTFNEHDEETELQIGAEVRMPMAKVQAEETRSEVD